MRKTGPGSRKDALPAMQFGPLLAAHSSQRGTAMPIARLGAARETAAEPPRHQQAKGPIRCVSLTDLFCWPLVLCCSARRKPSPASSASRFCRCGTSASRRRARCIGPGPASWSPNASPCSTTSGQFDVQFTRLKEVAPDLQFMERFTWVPGQSKLSLDFWWDEWLEDVGSSASCPAHVASSVRGPIKPVIDNIAALVGAFERLRNSAQSLRRPRPDHQTRACQERIDYRLSHGHVPNECRPASPI